MAHLPRHRYFTDQIISSAGNMLHSADIRTGIVAVAAGNTTAWTQPLAWISRPAAATQKVRLHQGITLISS